jgi:hypothetical protein
MRRRCTRYGVVQGRGPDTPTGRIPSTPDCDVQAESLGAARPPASATTLRWAGDSLDYSISNRVLKYTAKSGPSDVSKISPQRALSHGRL